LGQGIRIGDVDLGDVRTEVAPVVGDEAVRAQSDGGSQVRGIRCPQPVPAGQGGRELGGGAVHRAQVEAGQQAGQGADLVRRPVAQRLAEHLR
jgi:hypothetical protein